MSGVIIDEFLLDISTRISDEASTSAKFLFRGKMAAPVVKAASLAHIARESTDIHRLSQFYKEVYNFYLLLPYFFSIHNSFVYCSCYLVVQMFGFEEIESPNFGELKVIWLNLPSAFQLHLIERDPKSKLPEGPWNATSPVADPSHLPRGHHICFSVSSSNFDSVVHALKVNLQIYLKPRKPFEIFALSIDLIKR